MTEDERKGIHASTLKNLKKVMLSSPKKALKAHFYYSTKKTEALLVVNLVAKDANGSKAKRTSKAMIPKGQVVFGEVTRSGKKLLFSIKKGKGSTLKKSWLHPHLIEDKLGFLKSRSILGIFGQSVEPEAESVEDVTRDDFKAIFGEDIQDEDVADLEVLFQKQEHIAELNETINKMLLAQHSEEKEKQAKQLVRQLDILKNLQAQEPIDEEALSEERRSLAKMMYIGSDPFPKDGEPLSPEVKEILSISMDAMAGLLYDHLIRSASFIDEVHVQLEGKDDSWLAENATSLVQELKNHRAAVGSYIEQLQKQEFS